MSDWSSGNESDGRASERSPLQEDEHGDHVELAAVEKIARRLEPVLLEAHVGYLRKEFGLDHEPEHYREWAKYVARALVVAHHGPVQVPYYRYDANAPHHEELIHDGSYREGL